MVEAAGIEPASESTTLRLLHVYFVFFISDDQTPTDRLFIIPSPFLSSLVQGNHQIPACCPTLSSKHRQFQGSVLR